MLRKTKLTAGSIYKEVFLSAALILLSVVAFSQSSEAYLQTHVGKIKAGDTCVVQDDKFLDQSQWKGIEKHWLVENLVTFEIRFDTTLNFYRKKFACKLVADIEYQTADKSKKQLNNIPLEVNFDSAVGSSFNAIAHYRFNGGHRVKITVRSIESKELGKDLLPIFRIKNEIFINRSYTVNPSAPSPNLTAIEPSAIISRAAPSSTMFQFSPLHANDVPGQTLLLAWETAPFTGYTEYDLEWTFYDNYSEVVKGITAGTFLINDANLAELFKNNSTRITTGQSSYLLNLLYYDGYIFYRVRGIRYNVTSGEREESDWSYKRVDNTYYLYDFRTLGHEPRLNWQYSASFAEEGKKKEVISYFDGSLRNRQTVTLSNTEGKAIVQENVFDALGRPAVSILPAPTEENTIHYFHSFSQNLAGQTYSYTDFENANNCQPLPAKMNTATGASQYYSPNNPLKNDVNQYFFSKYIPDADGYPFAVTQYTPDNTGRIRLQGGVGEAFQPGSTITGKDRSTKYFYGKPSSQDELDRLFGSEAGNYEHYLKNMVMDANGQASISYVDANGRTVATALAGIKPDNLAALASYTAADNAAGKTFEVPNIINPEGLIRDASNLSVAFNSSFLASGAGSFTLAYEFTPLTLQILHGQLNEQICADCYYDLYIDVSNDCGASVLASPIVREVVFDNKTACTPSTKIDGSVTIPVAAAGEYHISYKLVLNRKAVDFYTEQYLVQNTSKKTELEFKRDYLKEVNLEGCFNNCETCDKELGTEQEFVTRMTKILLDEDNIVAQQVDIDWMKAMYSKLKTKCQELQQNCGKLEDPCEETINALKEDVSLGGQYMLYDELTNRFRERVVNVFLLNRAALSVNNAANTISPAVNGKTLLGLLTEEELISNWQPEWANILINYHPENANNQCLINGCADTYTSQVYDQRYLGTDNIADAVARGFWTVDNNLSLLANDPYFNNPANAAKRTAMINALNNYQNTSRGISEFVRWTVYCKDSDPRFENPCAASVRAACNREEEEWNLFKVFYLSLKLEIVNSGNTCVRNDIGLDAAQILKDGQYPPPCPSTALFELVKGDNNQLLVRYNGQNLVQSVQVGISKKTATASNLLFTISFPQNAISGTEISVTTLSNEAEFNEYFIEYSVCVGGYNQASVYKLKARRNNVVDFAKLKTIFNKPDGTPKTNAEVNAEQIARIVADCQETCEVNADSWISKLEGCNLTTTEISDIKTRLIAVCKGACDISRPVGASSTGTATPQGDRNFLDVLTAVLGVNRLTAVCNDLLINFPPSHNTNPVLSDEITRMPNNCAYNKLKTWKTENETSAVPLPSLAAYIKAKYDPEFSLTDVEIGQLLTAYETNCVAPDYIILPTSLVCTDQLPALPSCLSCQDITVAKLALETIYPYIGPSSANYWELLAAYLFKSKGFNTSSVDLYNAAQTCASNSGESFDCYLNNELVKGFSSNAAPGLMKYRLDPRGDANLKITDPATLFKNGSMQLPAPYNTENASWYVPFHIFRPARFCFNNGYAIEYRVKFPVNYPVNHPNNFFYLAGIPNNVLVVFGRYKNVPAGSEILNGVYLEAFVDETGYAHGSHNGGDISLFSYALASPDPEALNNWCNVKIEQNATEYKVYFNATLVITIPRRISTPWQDNFGQLYGAFQGNDFAIDRVRIFDETGTVQYSENFNNPSQPARVLNSKLCTPLPSCQTAFANYYNQQKGTNLSYAEIEALYLQQCGRALNVCEPNSTTIEQIVSDFAGSREAGAMKYAIWPRSNPNLQINDNTILFRNGAITLPDFYRKDPSYWYVPIVFDRRDRNFCFNNGYAVEYRLKYPTGTPSNHPANAFYLRGMPNGTAAVFSTARNQQLPDGRILNGVYLTGFSDGPYQYGTGEAGYLGLFDYALAHPNPDILNDWFTIRLERLGNQHRIYFNGSLVISLTRPDNVPWSDNGGYLEASFLGNDFAVDKLTIFDETGQPRFVEEFNDPLRPGRLESGSLCNPYNCEAGFTNYFNSVLGTSYTYTQIAALYLQQTGAVLNVCNINNTCAPIQSIVNNFNTSKAPGAMRYAVLYPGGQVLEDHQQIISNGALYIPVSNGNPVSESSVVAIRSERFCVPATGYKVSYRVKLQLDAGGAGIFHLKSIPASVTANFSVRAVGAPGGSPGIYIYGFADEFGNLYGQGNNETIFANQLINGDPALITTLWADITIEHRPSHYKVYFNGQLVITIPRNAGIPLVDAGGSVITLPGQAATISAGARYVTDFRLDRLAYSDINNNLLFVEEFNNPLRSARAVSYAFCTPLPSCETAFTNYFNQQQSANYTYAQIAALYKQGCGGSLDVCAPVAAQEFVLCNKPLSKKFPADKNSCIKEQIGVALGNGHRDYVEYINELKRDYRDAYYTKCLSIQPKMKLTAVYNNPYEYHYTLYYYDQAGNLVKTIPPAGVDLLPADRIAKVQNHRKSEKEYCYEFGDNPQFAATGYIQLPDQLHTRQGTEAFTLEAYVKFGGLSNQVILSKQATGANGKKEGYRLYVEGGQLRVALYGNNGEELWEKRELVDYYFRMPGFQPLPAPGSGPNDIVLKLPVKKYFARELSIEYVIGNLGTLSNLAPVGSWVHIAIRKTNNWQNPLQLFINGSLVTTEKISGTGQPVYGALPSTDIFGNPITVTQADIDNGIARFRAVRVPLTVSSVSVPLFIGDPLSSINGGIKQVRIYNRALPASEIRNNAFNTCLVPQSESNLVIWLPLNRPEEVSPNVYKPIDRINNVAAEPSLSNLFTGIFEPQYNNHQLPTRYHYNTLNQVRKQTSPDGGESNFWYDRLGRLVVSQNAEQLSSTRGEVSGRYSYTRYDVLGRIIQVGEKTGAAAITGIDTKSDAALQSWMASGTNIQVTETIYDDVNTAIVTDAGITNTQREYSNLRKRVVATLYRHTSTGGLADYNTATHYRYDISGNVKTLWQEHKKTFDNIAIGLTKRLDYNFDLVSGKVNSVKYQDGQVDQFMYKYDYDANNRLIKAWSGRTPITLKLDADYYYYLHGPLARTELGHTDSKVQGTDYAYTLQGWMKGMNGVTVTAPNAAPDATADMSKDGVAATKFSTVGKDALAFTLGYYGNDYTPIGGAASTAFGVQYQHPATLPATTGSALFNGNISNTTLAIGQFDGGLAKGYSYGYDQLNRILEMRQHTLPAFPGSSGSWNNSSINANNAYGESYGYDANGNILKLLRNGTTAGGRALAMDNLTYFYNYRTTSNTTATYNPQAPLPVNFKERLNNQLARVEDAVAAANYPIGAFPGEKDIDNQSSTNNYSYDRIGNLYADASEGITAIQWTVYGKIRSISKTVTGVTTNILYDYDAFGNRIAKQVSTGGTTTSTYYLRNASGNVIALYEKASAASAIAWKEQHLYGSSRLGIWNVPATPPTSTQEPAVGSKLFELSNHLGNVLVTISDKRLGIDPGNDGTVDYYVPEVMSAVDYYVFGMIMPGRSYQAGGYRYGFNGQEMSNEIKGLGNSYTAEFWEYDSRIGRRWNTDPIVKDDESPYMTFGNNPVVLIDPNGADWYKNKTTGNVEYKAKWHRNHKGYERLGKGDGDVLNYEGKEYNKKTGRVTAIMEAVTVTATRKKKDEVVGNRFPGFHWPGDYNKESLARSKAFHALIRDRHAAEQPLVQESDPQEYRDNFDYYERSWQANQSWRSINYAILDGATFFVPIPKVGILRWLRYGGRTFQEAKVAIWARNAKPVFQVIRNESTGKTFKVFAEIHHRYIPQRWGWPNWITNSRLNLQITNSIEHGLMDPYRHRFFPQWVKDGIETGTITAESVIRIK